MVNENAPNVTNAWYIALVAQMESVSTPEASLGTLLANIESYLASGCPMQDLVTILKQSSPAFVTMVLNARTVHDTATRRTAQAAREAERVRVAKLELAKTVALRTGPTPALDTTLKP